MKPIEFLVVATALVLGMNQPARAQGVTDMAKLTCAQLLEGSARVLSDRINATRDDGTGNVEELRT
jgi:hypothetical protein